MARVSRREKASMTIDVHAHLFNCRFLPIDGILKVWFRRAGVDDKVAEAVAVILNAATDDCSGRMLGRIRKRFDAQFSKMDEDELIELLWNQTPPEALAALPVLAVRSRPSKSGKTRQLTKAEFFALFHKAVRGRPLNLFETAEGFLRWFVLMTRCEAEIFSMLRRAYPAATLFVQHMMDMDNYYPGRSWYPFVTEQLPRMRDLTGSSKGQLLTFVAFDPKRKEWKEVLDVALRSCTGVKFYPPNGYRASGDSDPVVRKRIKEFFAYCVEKDVPVFTHCTPVGFEAFPHSGRLSDPVYWEPVLRTNRTLRLCFAHAGGGALWFGRTNDPESLAYGTKVIELCQTYPNAYCEVGYLDEILTPNGPKRFRTVLESLITGPGGDRLSNRIMYGTDWHMIFRLQDHRRYLAAFAEAFESPVLRQVRDRFFRENAIRYLKLPQSLILKTRTKRREREASK